MPVVTKKEVRENLTKDTVVEIAKAAQARADMGFDSLLYRIPRDIFDDVLELLRKEHEVWLYPGSHTSYYEYEKEVKLTWRTV